MSARTMAAAAAVIVCAGLAVGAPKRATPDAINTDFTLDFASDVLASIAVPEDSSIADDFVNDERRERTVMVFAVGDGDGGEEEEEASGGFDLVFQGTTGRVYGRPGNVGDLEPSERGHTNCELKKGIVEYDLIGDVAFSTDGGIVVAEVSVRGKDCKPGTRLEGVGVWTVYPGGRNGGRAVNGIFLVDMETFESVSTLRDDDRALPGDGAAVILGRNADGAAMTYVIERRETVR